MDRRLEYINLNAILAYPFDLIIKLKPQSFQFIYDLNILLKYQSFSIYNIKVHLILMCFYSYCILKFEFTIFLNDIKVNVKSLTMRKHENCKKIVFSSRIKNDPY